LNTLRCVLADDKLWFSILRGIQADFRYQTVTADDIFGYVNKKSGNDLTYFFNQYLRHAALPTLVLETRLEGETTALRYRWQADVADFRMPIKVTTASNKFEFITPTTEWQTMVLRGLKPDDFKVAEDLFYVKVQRQ
jgi:aminopeptidase N